MGPRPDRLRSNGHPMGLKWLGRWVGSLAWDCSLAGSQIYVVAAVAGVLLSPSDPYEAGHSGPRAWPHQHDVLLQESPLAMLEAVELPLLLKTV